jgi:heme/copper-type cytochrome/quinol oxidase subunit 2
MKWITVLSSLAIKTFNTISNQRNSSIEEVKQLIKQNSVKLLLVLSAASALGSLFVAGVVITTLTLTTQYEATNRIRYSNILGGGLGLTIASLIIFSFLFYYSFKSQRQTKKEDKAKKEDYQSIEQAFLLLVNEFVAEREFKRELKTKTRNETRKSEQDIKDNEFKKNERQKSIRPIHSTERH